MSVGSVAPGTPAARGADRCGRDPGGGRYAGQHHHPAARRAGQAPGRNADPAHDPAGRHRPRPSRSRQFAGVDKQPALGITADRVATFPGIHVKIGIDPNIVGGPSAGTALALGIIDKLTPGGLTGGRTIAGTGTVDGFGTVGPIGGLQQKIAAAVKAGATVFFAPASECSQATSVAPKSLTLIKVDTLQTVVTALQDIKAGNSNFPHC